MKYGRLLAVVVAGISALSIIALVAHDNAAQDAYSHIIVIEYSPAEIPGLYRDKPVEPTTVAEKDLEPVPKITKMLERLLEAPKYKMEELLQSLENRGDSDPPYLVVMTGPFSYEGTILLTDAELGRYLNFLDQNIISVGYLTESRYYLFEFKDEVFDLEINPPPERAMGWQHYANVRDLRLNDANK